MDTKFKVEYIPYFIGFKNILQENDLIIYGFIVMYQKLYPQTNFYFTNKQISQILNIKIDSIQKSLDFLQSNGMIKQTKFGGKNNKGRKILLSNKDTSDNSK